MTVRILPNIPGDAAAQLAQLISSASDSLAVAKVLHDGYMQLNIQLADTKLMESQNSAAVSGAFVLSGGRFYLIQGRKHSDASLDKWELASGRKIPPALREEYKQKGGALQLEGKCMVLGTLKTGREVLDRITALPSDVDGRPLRRVSFHVKQFNN